MPHLLKKTHGRRQLLSAKTPRQTIINPLQKFMAFCSDYLKHSKNKPDFTRAQEAANLLESIPNNQISKLINETHLAGNNLLIIAILQGAKSVAEGLIPFMSGKALCDISHNNMSAVSAACKMGYEGMLESVFKHIIEWHTERNQGSGIPACKRLVHQLDSKGNTPLILAAQAGSTRLCFTLLKYANNPLNYLLQKNNQGQSAMSIAAGKFADHGADATVSRTYMDLFQFLQKKEEDLERLSLIVNNSQDRFHFVAVRPLRANRLLIWPPLPNVREEAPRPISRRNTSSSSSLESNFPAAPTT